MTFCVVYFTNKKDLSGCFNEVLRFFFSLFTADLDPGWIIF